jgi:MFS family permease
VGGILSPTISGSLCNKYGDKIGYRIVFCICGALALCAAIWFVVFATDRPLEADRAPEKFAKHHDELPIADQLIADEPIVSK